MFYRFNSTSLSEILPGETHRDLRNKMAEYLNDQVSSFLMWQEEKLIEYIRINLADILNYEEGPVEVKNILKFALKSKDSEILGYFANPLYLKALLPCNKFQEIFHKDNVTGRLLYLLGKLQKEYKLNLNIMLMLASLNLTESAYTAYTNTIKSKSHKQQMFIESYKIYNIYRHFSHKQHNQEENKERIKKILNCFKHIIKIAAEFKYSIDSDVYLLVGVVLYKYLGNKSKAYNLLIKTLEIEPENHDALYVLGEYHISNGEKNKAVTFLRKLHNLYTTKHVFDEFSEFNIYKVKEKLDLLNNDLEQIDLTPEFFQITV